VLVSGKLFGKVSLCGDGASYILMRVQPVKFWNPRLGSPLLK
jgi:hypothetical protein